jgi:hypothetical protein
MAASAPLKIRAARRNALCGGLQNIVSVAACESRLLLEQFRFDCFPFENKRQENGLAAPVLIRRQTCQAISTVDQFFNCEPQGN